MSLPKMTCWLSLIITNFLLQTQKKYGYTQISYTDQHVFSKWLWFGLVLIISRLRLRCRRGEKENKRPQLIVFSGTLPDPPALLGKVYFPDPVTLSKSFSPSRLILSHTLSAKLFTQSISWPRCSLPKHLSRKQHYLPATGPPPPHCDRETLV